MKTRRKGSLFAGDQNELPELQNVNLTCFMTRHEFLNSLYLVPLAKRQQKVVPVVTPVAAQTSALLKNSPSQNVNQKKL